MGVGLVLDDFGTGSSSLAMLDALPFDGLKLDRASVMRIGPAGRTTPLVKAIVDLAHTLGLSLVAEGIETDRQLVELRRLGVREGQGFHLSPPLPADGFERLLRDGDVLAQIVTPVDTTRLGRAREHPRRARRGSTTGSATAA